MKKVVLIGLLLCALIFASKPRAVKASPHIWVPYDYPTIQAAINAAYPGDTIHVASGTYEHIVVNKTVSIIAEGEAIIDARKSHDGIKVTADKVCIYNFKIQNASTPPPHTGYSGIWLENTSFCHVENNHIMDFDYGIVLDHALESRLFNNNIRNCSWSGIHLFKSSSNYIAANTIYNSTSSAISLDSSSNLNTILDNRITGGRRSIHIGYCSNNNTIYNNWINSSISSVSLASGASNNVIYHNNFIGDTNVVQIDNTSVNNKWYLSWPIGGNFWSNHVSPDNLSGAHQNEQGSDGICDNYYIIDEYLHVIDAYPLMGPCNRFEEKFGPIPSKQEISIISNSSISAFQMNITQRTISFNVSGNAGMGFCRVDIPNVIVSGLWQNKYKVLINNQEPLYMRNWASGATTYIYFKYQHSTKEVIIVPEFPKSLMLPIFIIVTTLFAAKAKRSTRNNENRQTPPFFYPP